MTFKDRNPVNRLGNPELAESSVFCVQGAATFGKHVFGIG